MADPFERQITGEHCSIGALGALHCDFSAMSADDLRPVNNHLEAMSAAAGFKHAA